MAKKGKEMENQILRFVFNLFNRADSMKGSGVALIEKNIRSAGNMRSGVPEQSYSPLAGNLYGEVNKANGWVKCGQAWWVQLIDASKSYGKGGFIFALALERGRKSHIPNINGGAKYAWRYWFAGRTNDLAELKMIINAKTSTGGKDEDGVIIKTEEFKAMVKMIENGSFPRLEIIKPKAGTTLAFGKKEERDLLN